MSIVDVKIVLFDGVCNFCNSSVQFVLKRDPEGRFRYAPLQSEPGARLLREHGISGIDSFVLIEGGRAYVKSEAALRVCRSLPGLWKLLALLRIVPRPLRDAVYDAIARRRDRWFGARASCMLPTPEQRGRFLEGADRMADRMEARIAARPVSSAAARAAETGSGDARRGG
ncbi:thiol-disulfide oxidoreductase DCC family protein [Paenibacillus sp. IB182496]|uniref:Thiol-disulfide oxidoreductase DCC family protein n=1 Tax=Paenibacillus sabuli TaxID=2772509 RepID=A0A927BVK5_9BACL|nr:thiol-disulfide oxidoreductase DCC family protein [Paenibacillus sabuli]MBD2846460.1 thiol-disulfide oxidoreductase DCC family protein [Paenibacillus sabuli]